MARAGRDGEDLAARGGFGPIIKILSGLAALPLNSGR